MQKLVSIISPCYNGAKYLPQYLESILNQSYSNIELILVNDASTDSTIQIAESYRQWLENRMFKYIILTQPSNRGQAAAINAGLQVFSGDYVMWMDSDDIFLNNAIEEKVAFLESNPECDFVLNRGIVVDENDMEKEIGTLQRTKPEGEDNLFSDLIYERNVIFVPGGICVRSNVLRTAIPNLNIYESREGQNWQLMLPLAYSFRCGYIDKPLFKYVVHSNSHSHEKRTYEQRISRLENCEILLNETLDRIECMPHNEREEWKKKIKIKYLYAKLNTASEYRLRAEYRKCKRELQTEGLPVSIFKSYDLYHLKRLFLLARFKICHY